MTTAEYSGLQKLILGVRDELKDEIRDQVQTSAADLRAEMNQRFDKVNQRFDEVYGRFDEVYGRLDEVYERFDEAEIIQNNILNAIGEEHAKFERIDANHEQRISRLEARAA